ncbi:hypothetical protein D3C81_2049140 [compost metagenome]
MSVEDLDPIELDQYKTVLPFLNTLEPPARSQASCPSPQRSEYENRPYFEQKIRPFSLQEKYQPFSLGRVSTESALASIV